MKYLLFLVTLCFSLEASASVQNAKHSVNTFAYNEKHFTPKQIYLMKLAEKEGAKIGFPKTIQAILWQETHAGVYGPVSYAKAPIGKNAYCPMQIKLGTARDVLVKYKMPIPKTEEELLVKLLTDDEFCIKLGALYFKMLHDKTKNWSKAVLAYNQGLGGMRQGKDPGDYVKKIKGVLFKEVSVFNGKYK